jgi:hypothetical protein
MTDRACFWAAVTAVVLLLFICLAQISVWFWPVFAIGSALALFGFGRQVYFSVREWL